MINYSNILELDEFDQRRLFFERSRFGGLWLVRMALARRTATYRWINDDFML